MNTNVDQVLPHECPAPVCTEQVDPGLLAVLGHDDLAGLVRQAAALTEVPRR